MNYSVAPTLPYLGDPDFRQAFLAEVTSISGYPIEVTALDHGEVYVNLSVDQARELGRQPLVGTVGLVADLEMACERRFLVLQA